MRTFRLHKLVRDDLVKMMQELGQDVDFRVLEKHEYLEALRSKLVEEIAEFDPAKPSALSELADLQEAINQMVLALGATPDAFKKLQQGKADKKGGFTKGLFVETVSMADDDPWASYYAAEPERFPEITT